MALSELVALETAYRALQPLESAARRRGLRWLRDALEVSAPLSETTSKRNKKLQNPQVPRNAVVENPEEEVAGEAGGNPGADSSNGAERPRQRGTGRKTRSRRSTKTNTKSDDSGKERVYRRMPPAEEVLRAYAEVGTISGLADYFDVPRHTVQGWARRLRGAGYVIGRGA